MLGVRVIPANLEGLHGAYMHDHRAIVIDRRMGPIQCRSTLMHELGHAYHEHTGTTPRSECQASEWAARQMIRGCEFAAASLVHEKPEAVALELGVLPRDVVNYQRWLDSAGWTISRD